MRRAKRLEKRRVALLRLGCTEKRGVEAHQAAKARKRDHPAQRKPDLEARHRIPPRAARLQLHRPHGSQQAGGEKHYWQAERESGQLANRQRVVERGGDRVRRRTAARGPGFVFRADPALADRCGTWPGGTVLARSTLNRRGTRARPLATRSAGKLWLTLGFDAALAQRIYAGSDLFLMPSRFEPCGLGQLISFRYGTIPVVHAVGGLAETVRDVDADPKTGNGFSFSSYAAGAFSAALDRSARHFSAGGAAWRGLVQRVMREDHSWGASAMRYVDLYKKAVKLRRSA